MTPTFSVPATERRQRYERAWEIGELLEIINVYADVLSNRAANDERRRVLPGQDPLHRRRSPRPRRRCARPTIRSAPSAVSRHELLRHLQPAARAPGRPPKAPDRNITETGIDTVDESFEFDAIVFATGFDAVTGAIAAVDIDGRDGVTLRDKWANGPSTYLGLTAAGFPNLFLITGSRQPVGAVEHGRVDRTARRLDGRLPRPPAHARLRCDRTDEAAEAGWMQHVNDCAVITLSPRRTPGTWAPTCRASPARLPALRRGVDFYRRLRRSVVARNYLGFKMSGPTGLALSMTGSCAACSPTWRWCSTSWPR